MAKQPDLDAAYALSSNDDVVALYRDWAGSYDADFGQAQGYQLPQQVAATFTKLGGDGPVLDVGAGTGLVGALLAQGGIGPIDGLDLSQDMLSIAREKACYDALIAADVTKPLALAKRYRGIVSAGTFTHGHVGPNALDHLLDVAADGAVFVLSVNAEHYTALGFDAKLTALDTEIGDIRKIETRIYDDRADAAHRDDTALLICFKKSTGRS